MILNLFTQENDEQLKQETREKNMDKWLNYF